MSFWQPNPIALPQLLAAMSAGIASAIAWRRRKDTPGAIWILGVLVTAMWWSLMGSLEILSVTLQAKMVFSQLSYVGIELSPFFFWRFVYSYSLESNQPPLWLRRSLEIFIFVTLWLVFTNPWHMMVWSELHLIQVDRFFYAFYGRGSWFWINAAYCYGLMFTSGFMLIRHAWISTGAFRHQSLVMIVAASCPWLFSAVYLSRLGPLSYVDHTPVGFVGSGILMGWIVLRRGLIDVEPVATRTLFERMTDPVFVVDKRDRLILANPAALARFGLPLQHVGLPLSILLAQYPALLEAFSLKLGRKRSPIEDHGAWWDIEPSLITNSLGHERGFLFVLRDTTALQNARLRADDLAQKARSANDAKSIFLAQVSHDLRTPMHAILGTADLLKATTLSAPQEADVNTIREAGESLLHLINDLLDLSRIESGKVELASAAFQLDDVLDPVMDLLGVVARRKGLTLVHWVEPGLKGGLRGDPERLRQIILNLAGNAVKFTPSGRVSISVSGLPHSDKMLRLEVKDTGPGIPRESIPTLFAPFERGKLKATRRTEGTGLGLAIVKRLVDAMDGKIEVQSTLNAGSSFIVLLPIVDDSATSHFFTYCLSHMSDRRVALAMSESIRKTAVRMDVTNLGARVIDWLPGTLAPEAEVLIVEQADRDGSLATTWKTMGRRLIALSAHSTKSVQDLVAIKRRDLALAIIGDELPVDSTPGPFARPNKIAALLADDNPLSSRVSAALLERLGCVVTIVDNGKSVLDILEKQKFDLLILDGQMPEMNGWEVVRNLRMSKRPLQPLIALSADLTPEAHAKWRQQGISTILPKPVNLETLGLTIAALFEKSTDSSADHGKMPGSGDTSQ